MAEPPETIVREVWATPAEFQHGLTLAFPGRVVERGRVLYASDGNAAMEIVLEVLMPRTIAQISMPRMKVSLHLTAGTHAEKNAMLNRMDLAMHRGGG